MSPLRGEENSNGNSIKKNSSIDSSDVAKQQIGSQFSLCGVLDDFLCPTSMMPIDDPYLLEDAFETQLVNPTEETQMMNFAEDTQVVDLAEESQAVDLAEETQSVDLAEQTQAVDLAEETQAVDLVEETQAVDLAEETQVMDLAKETQVMDLARETQIVDLAGETQVLDDIDCMENMPIEFSNELDGEVGSVSECEDTITTNVMCETQELSQDDLGKNEGSDSVGRRSTSAKDLPREGSVCRGFTSIRTASIRASGLAAHARRSNSNLCATSSYKSSLEKDDCEQNVSSVVEHSFKSGRTNGQECLENEHNDNSEKLRSANQRKVGSTVVRKLFREDEDEVGDSETEDDQSDDNLNMPEQGFEECFAGLSYANSQEPGELSQAHALEVVDKFLDLNFMEDDEGCGIRVHKTEKPKVVSAANGSRDLAKSSILKRTVGDCGIYDWDDTCEDDGGGEFFLKKKELFFSPKQRCLTEPRKSNNPGFGNAKIVGDCVDEKETKFTNKRLGDPGYSDSGLMLRKLRSKGKSLHREEKILQEDVTKNLDEQLHMVSELAEKDTDRDVSDMRNIGPDTQMAAEAMETLCFEVNLAERDISGPNKGVHSTAKAGRENKLRKRTAHSEQKLASRIPCPNSIGVVTRQAKRTKRISIDESNESSLSPKQCKKNRKKCEKVLEEAEERRLADVNVSGDNGMHTAGQRPEEKCVVKDQLDFYVPVAHRTRESTALNLSKVGATSSDGREEINDVISAHLRGKRTVAKDKNAETVAIEKVRKVSRRKTSADRRHSERLKRPSKVATSLHVNPDTDRLNNSSTSNDQAIPCLDTQSKKTISTRTVRTRSSKNGAAQCESDHLNTKTILNDAVGAGRSKQGHERSDDGTSVEGAKRTSIEEASPICRTSSSNCATPANCTAPINNPSPICMGDEYHKQSCRKNLSKLSLVKELDDLLTGSPGEYGRVRESRKRRDITTVRVLFSQHLDEDAVKQQKKILTRLGGAVASCMSDATHFVADEFVRTRNVLEAIASGKPVVTHLWIESCGQASCLIDEKNYILRDVRKEKEFGFCLPVSLAKACHHPLLQGQKVLITPNTKPGKEILANLVKAVQGLVIERLGRSVLNGTRLPDELLILSCEEDYEDCVPFLEKGGAIYSSELLLNGIVKQKLEYERHRLFEDHVKRTRSTVWVKKQNRFLPVTK